MDLSIGSPALWTGFTAFVLAMLAVDLGIFHRRARAVGFREALGWSAAWVGLALCFNLGVWQTFGPERGMEFLTGYLIEKSLSIDNIFVFLVIFATLGIPAAYQHRILFWGIVSALVMRAAMIFAGAALLERFHWLVYVFGAFLVLTGIKIFLQREREMHPDAGLLMRLIRRAVPSTARLDGERFFTRQGGRWLATPLFTALLLVEVTDAIGPFRYLKVGLASVLVFVGAKMALVDVYEFPVGASLAIVFLILFTSIAASWLSSCPLRTPARELET